MKKLICFLTLLIASIVCYAQESFSTEDDDLVEIPKVIDTQIHKSQAIATDCKLMGKPIDLTDRGKKDFLVVGKDNCEIGAASRPIWIVKNNRVVLYIQGGQGIEIKSHKTHGAYDIQASHGTAGVASVQFWSFNGKRYQNVKSYIFTPEDEKGCQAHPDICPYQNY